MIIVEYPKALYLRGWDDLEACVTVHDRAQEDDARAMGYRMLSEPVGAPDMEDDATEAPKLRKRSPKALAE